MKKRRTPRTAARPASRKPPANPRAGAQTRRILGRHYAAKYRAGRR